LEFPADAEAVDLVLVACGEVDHTRVALHSSQTYPFV
jgi:hypothetical protein